MFLLVCLFQSPAYFMSVTLCIQASVNCLFSLGILYGTMTLELGGTVNITCQKTGYSAILEFKLKVSK